MKYLGIVFFAFVFFSSCSHTYQNTEDAIPRNPKTVTSTNEISLLNMIQRLPGVTVRGSGRNVTIRNFTGNSFVDSTEPLCLVNGIDYGNSFQDIENSINVFSVESISVYKSAAKIARYGVCGANGVINILLK